MRLVRVCRNTFVLSSFIVCVATCPPLFRPSCIHVTCDSRFPVPSCSQARIFARPSGRWQPRVRKKGCRTAVRVKFRERPRTCAHGSTTPTHLEGCLHNERRLSPVVRGHISIYEEAAVISAVLCEIFAGNFEQEFSQKFRSGDIFIAMGKKKFLNTTDSTLAPPQNQRFSSTTVSCLLHTRKDVTQKTSAPYFSRLQRSIER